MKVEPQHLRSKESEKNTEKYLRKENIEFVHRHGGYRKDMSNDCEFLDYLESYGIELDKIEDLEELKTHDWYYSEPGPDNTFDAQFVCSRCDERISINIEQCHNNIYRYGNVKFGRPSCNHRTMNEALE